MSLATTPRRAARARYSTVKATVRYFGARHVSVSAFVSAAGGGSGRALLVCLIPAPLTAPRAPRRTRSAGTRVLFHAYLDDGGGRRLDRAPAPGRTHRCASPGAKTAAKAHELGIRRRAATGRLSPTRALPANADALLLDDGEGLLSRIATDVDCIVMDCDGVIWQGDTLLPGARESIALLREQGKRLVFVTNNSNKSRAQYVYKFDSWHHGGGEEIFSRARRRRPPEDAQVRQEGVCGWRSRRRRRAQRCRSRWTPACSTPWRARSRTGRSRPRRRRRRGDRGAGRRSRTPSWRPSLAIQRGDVCRHQPRRADAPAGMTPARRVCGGGDRVRGAPRCTRGSRARSCWSRSRAPRGHEPHAVVGDRLDPTWRPARRRRGRHRPGAQRREHATTWTTPSRRRARDEDAPRAGLHCRACCRCSA